jgi:nucleoside-diphosphate-sugar epimerase
MQVVVTGASGFIGQHVARDLAKAGHQLLLLGGHKIPTLPPGKHRSLALGAMEECKNLSSVIEGSECVVHLAGRAHVMRETQADPETLFHNANVVAVKNLLDAMKHVGVNRLVLLSSIAARKPVNAYGRTKLAGEVEALKLGKEFSIDVVALRPPLVYGPNAPGNLRRLISLINTGLPLPFGSVNNQRSLCSVYNVSDAVTQILSSPPRTGIYEICDNDIVSLKDIVTVLGRSMNKNVRMFPTPHLLLHHLAALFSESVAESLFGDLTLDNSAFQNDFNWIPIENTLSGLKKVSGLLL